MNEEGKLIQDLMDEQWCELLGDFASQRDDVTLREVESYMSRRWYVYPKILIAAILEGLNGRKTNP